jgi:hypothetical protein
MKKPILTLLMMSGFVLGLSACGTSGAVDTSADTRTVTGTVTEVAASESAVLALNNGTCDLTGDIVIRAIPAAGDVVDASVDETNGAFSFDLLEDRTYMVLIFQDGVFCAYMVNAQGEPSLIGIGDQDFSFGDITLDDNGNFDPENDCEDEYDSDEDGTADASDDDFDGDGVDDSSEDDSDSDGIEDDYDCDDDDDGSFDDDDSDDDGDEINDEDEIDDEDEEDDEDDNSLDDSIDDSSDDSVDN